MAQVHSQPAHDSAFEAFLEVYPSYRDTTSLDDVRTCDFGRLDEHRHVYLDHAILLVSSCF